MRASTAYKMSRSVPAAMIAILDCSRSPYAGVRQCHHRLGRKSRSCRFADRARRRDTVGLRGSAHDGDGPRGDV
jgi:hypothetical protein